MWKNSKHSWHLQDASFAKATLRHKPTFADKPGKIILKDPHENDDNEAQQQHHQHQWVDDGQPVDLQCFREEWVVSEALSSPGMRQMGLEPAHAVGVGDRQAAPTYPDSTHSCACSLLQGDGFDVFYWNIGKDHRVAVVLDVEV